MKRVHVFPLILLVVFWLTGCAASSQVVQPSAEASAIESQVSEKSAQSKQGAEFVGVVLDTVKAGRFDTAIN